MKVVKERIKQIWAEAEELDLEDPDDELDFFYLDKRLAALSPERYNPDIILARAMAEAENILRRQKTQVS